MQNKVKKPSVTTGLSLLIASALVSVALAKDTKPTKVDKENVCKANLLTLASAMNHFASAHGGKYANESNEIIPDHLAKMPVCPSGGKYELQSGGWALGNVEGFQDYYIWTCSSKYHTRGWGFNSTQGLVNPVNLKRIKTP